MLGIFIMQDHLDICYDGNIEDLLYDDEAIIGDLRSPSIESYNQV